MRHEVEITGLAHGGDGIGRLDGQVCFIPRCLPGDVVRIEGVEKRRGVLRGETVERTTPSPLRQSVDCPVFGTCGGCTWLDFAYPGQGEWKQRIVQDCIARIGKVDAEVEFREDPSLRHGYRTRATFHGRDGGWGFFAEGTHDVVPIEACPLCHERLNQALARLQGVSGPDFVEITIDPESDAVLCWCDSVSTSLRKAFPDAQSPSNAPRRDGFEFDGVPVVNGAFAQSSLPLNRLLSKTAAECLGEPASLLDLYCGTGNFSLAPGKRTEVVGIDHNGVSIMVAMRKERGEYRVGDESAMRELIGQRPWDAIVLDPPRTGARRIMKTLARATCEQIVYVSCDPATLARDARVLMDQGWAMERLIAVDMFPHTPHIETVSLFRRG